VASIATGVGALIAPEELAGLGAASGVLGAGSGATDLPACVGGSALACAGAAAGVVSGAGSVVGAGITAGVRAGVLGSTTTTQIATGLSGSLGFASGVGTGFFDWLNYLVGNG